MVCVPIRIKPRSAVWKRSARYTEWNLWTTRHLFLSFIFKYKALLLAFTIRSRCCHLPCPHGIRRQVTMESLGSFCWTSLYVRYGHGEVALRAVHVRLELFLRRLMHPAPPKLLQT